MFVAMRWANLVTTIGLMIVIPPLGGWWLDGYWGTAPWLLVVGVVLGFLGFLSGMRDLLRLANREAGRPGGNGPRRPS